MAQKIYDTQKALKSVADALKLDSENFDKDAYIKYLESISIIASTLSSDQQLDISDAKHLSTQQRQKLIDVARQCLDRVDILSKKLIGENGNLSPTSENFATTASSEYRQKPQAKVENTIRRNTVIPSSLNIANSTTNSSNASILETIDWVSPEPSIEEASLVSIKRMSPLEKTHQENKTLIALYKKRSLRAKSPQVRINLSLELQRRLAENLQVGHTQQEIYLRQLREQQEKQLNEITKKVQSLEEISSKELIHRRELCSRIIEYEQGQNWIEDSKKRLVQNPSDTDLAVSIVRHILRDTKHPISKEMQQKSEQLRSKILPLIEAHSTNSSPSPEADPASSASCSSCSDSENVEPNVETDFTSCTRAENENASEDFKATYEHGAEDVELALKAGKALMSTLRSTLKKQKSVLKKGSTIHFKKGKPKDKLVRSSSSHELSKKRKSQIKTMELEALQRHLENIASEVREATDELVELISLTCEPMDRGENHGFCYSIVEDCFFPNIWPLLLHLGKFAYVRDERHVAETMDKLRDCTPVMLGFNTDSSSAQPAQDDYDEAISLLKRITELQTPTKKLEALVLVAKTLCEKRSSTSDGSQDSKKVKPVGADDLIPLLSYVCIRSNLPQLILECNLLEHLILQKYLMGEAGYCLTSLQTALQYIQTFEPKNVPEPAETAV